MFCVRGAGRLGTGPRANMGCVNVEMCSKGSCS